MEFYCDLHCHSVFSDGTDTPAALVEKAKAAGLSALALTDHNTASGLPDFLAAAEGQGIEAVPGVEFSVDYNGTELHILGLYIPVEYFSQVEALMEQYHHRKEQSNVELVAALNRAGYQLDYEKIKMATPKGQVNRALIGAELTRLGYTSSVKEAFSMLLSPKCGYYVPPQRPEPKEMLGIIRDLGAVSVLAHPLLSLKKEAVAELLPKAASWGLQAMEVYYSTYDEAETAAACQLAQAHGLAYSGGSDYHGGNKPDIALGRGKGNLQIPLEWLEQLKTHRAI